MIYEIETTGTSREIYVVDAASKEEAEYKLKHGEATCILTEVEFDTIVGVKERNG